MNEHIEHQMSEYIRQLSDISLANLNKNNFLIIIEKLCQIIDVFFQQGVTDPVISAALRQSLYEHLEVDTSNKIELRNIDQLIDGAFKLHRNDSQHKLQL